LRAFQVAALVALLSIPETGVAIGQQTSWITQDVATEYVKNLLSTYNADFTATYGSSVNPNFTKDFRLYQSYGYSFNVTVMRWIPNSTDFIAFIFNPINSFSPIVTIDSNSYLQPILFLQFPTFLAHPKLNNNLGFAQRQSAYNGTSGAGYGPFIWIANSTTLFADPMTSSAQTANFLFRNDQSAVPPPNPPNPILDFLSNPWVLAIIGIVGFVASILYINEVVRRRLHPPKKKHKKRK
jgi:hypothetical protein